LTGFYKAIKNKLRDNQEIKIELERISKEEEHEIALLENDKSDHQRIVFGVLQAYISYFI